jgi:hypothetical protein
MNQFSMSPIAQLVVAAVSAGLPTLTVLVSILLNNQRLTDLKVHLDQRLSEHRDLFRSELYRVEQVMDARLKHLEEHLIR